MKLFLFVILMLQCLGEASFASQGLSLYQAEVPVMAKTEEFQEQAMAKGLLQVLTKLSLDQSIATHPLIQESLAKASYFVQEFSYLPSTTDAAQYQLKISYDAADVLRLLNKTGLSYWAAKRPVIMVFLAISKQQELEIISEERATSLLTLIKEQGDKFGFPLIFPLMDLNDLQHIPAGEMSSSALAILLNAAKRYAPEALLLAIIEQKEGRLMSQWQLYADNQNWSGSLIQENEESLIKDLFNQVHHTLAQNYLLKNMQQALHLEVMNINKQGEIDELIALLKKMPIVLRVGLSSSANDVVDINLLLNGSLESFRQQAARDSRLALKYADLTEHKMGYVWVSN